MVAFYKKGLYNIPILIMRKDKYTMLNTKQQEFVDYAVQKFGTNELTTAELKEANAHFGCKYAPQWLIKNADYKVGKSTFRLPTEANMVSTASTVKASVPETEKVLTTKAPETETVSEAAYVVSSLTGDIVPKKDPVFVSFGNYPDVKSIIRSKMFYPVFITGLSGNGKTMGVTQACAENKRELIRVNITIETDEDDLLGGYRLKDGQTVWQNGPVIEAMERGAVLLLDEIEKAHPDLFNLLLQVMDHGKLTDNNGKAIDFRNTILIMTTNAGAQELSKSAIGFKQENREGADGEAIEKLFAPEFRNRLDAIIPFGSLPLEVVRMVVDKFIMQLEAQLSEKGVSVLLTDKSRDWLARKGYDKTFGARPIARVIQEHIKKPLAEELLFGRLVDGGTVNVDLSKDKLILKTLGLTNKENKKKHSSSKHKDTPELT